MAAYIIVRVEVTDRIQYSKYAEQTPATIAKFGGRFLARGGESVTLEGPDETRRVVILEDRQEAPRRRCERGTAGHRRGMRTAPASFLGELNPACGIPPAVILL
jgi:uncharacterized protein (DUF1330 family)